MLKTNKAGAATGKPRPSRRDAHDTTSLPPAPMPGTRHSMLLRTPPRHLRLAAWAAWLALSAAPLTAHALGLGPAHVLSAIGEPLDASVDVIQIDADEAASLRVGVAPAAAFRSAGIDYNTALVGAKVTLQQRPDGTRVLRIKGERAVNEPFLDLVLEANWASGRLTREYTLLFDPPRQAAAVEAPTAAVTPAVVPVAPAAPAQAAAPAPAATGTGARPPSPATVTVRRGDTALSIASRHKPAGASLEQALIALLRANPDAFIGGNVNRLRAGAVVRLPDEATVRGVDPGEARQQLALQTRDFNAFRGHLAQAAPSVQTEGAGRAAAGKIETQVTEQRAAAATPDKLRLSKATVAATTASREAQIAADLRKKEAEQRLAELTRNTQELAKLQASSAALGAGAGAAASAAPKPGVAVPVGAPVASAASAASVPVAPSAAAASAPSATAASAVPAAAASSASASASAAASAASSPATAPAAAASAGASKPKAKPAATPAPVAEPSFLDALLDNPWVPAGGAALVALLAGFGIYRLRAAKSAKQTDESSFLESRVQPDSFFGSSGGQHVDTSDEKPSGNSSLAYSPSQLDAGGDVDPVAEADVYLAYGRDLQAEEILKEALKVHPNRVAIHVKLAEIYAKRRDARAVESLAKQALRVTDGQGPEWERLCEIGRSLDPNNPVYQGQPAVESTPPAAESAPAPLFAPSTIPVNPKPEFSPSQSGVDFDLSQFDSPEPTPQATDAAPLSEPAMHPPEPTPALATPAEPMASQPTASNPVASPPVAAAPATPKDEPLLEFDLGTLSLDLEPPASQTPAATAATTLPPLDFDTGATAATAAPVATAPADIDEADALQTKLALAQELRAIGDTEGARALADEVVAAAAGPLKIKAQQFRSDLG